MQPKRILITGASSGIGAATARQLSGFKISDAHIKKAVTQIRSEGRLQSITKGKLRKYVSKGNEILVDHFKFSSYTSEGMWDDNNGDYGNEKCSGYVKQQNKKIELEVICENINQNNEIFWNSRIRKSEKGGGAGKMKILNGTGKYKKLIGLTCPYGVN